MSRTLEELIVSTRSKGPHQFPLEVDMFIAHEKPSENKETLPISSVASWVVSTEPAQHDPGQELPAAPPPGRTELLGFFIAPPSCCYELWVRRGSGGVQLMFSMLLKDVQNSESEKSWSGPVEAEPPGDLRPDQVTSDQVTSDQVTSDQVTSDQVTSDQTRPSDLRPGDLRPGDLRPGDLRPDQVTSDQVTSDQVTSDQVTSDQVTSDQVTSDQVTSDQTR
ncbi:Duffy receptor beta form [Liparis tanakae]|uniref:Duffy receptor beta form n=1 Tax=Liparis tanakae TaxID=230148 RepID=A0A4Z2EVA3_9TELE|nr:Duffy receptor beta form [Liparis tanakae]